MLTSIRALYDSVIEVDPGENRQFGLTHENELHYSNRFKDNQSHIHLFKCLHSRPFVNMVDAFSFFLIELAFRTKPVKE